MNKVRCDYCGVEINNDDAVPCHWDKYNLTWYYCKRCEEGVFGGKVKNKKVLDRLIEDNE